jgi:hypothetical protein
MNQHKKKKGKPNLTDNLKHGLFLLVCLLIGSGLGLGFNIVLIGLKYNFGSYLVLKLMYASVSIILFGMLILLSWHFLLKLVYRRIFNGWLLFTIYLMFSFFIVGFIFISDQYGPPTFSYTMTNLSNASQQLAVLKCPVGGTRLVAGEFVLCSLDVDLVNMTGQYYFYYTSNGSPVIKNSSDYIGFQAPNFVNRNSIIIHGMRNDSSIALFSDNYYIFPDSGEYQTRHDKLVGFLIGLIGIVLFSCPVFVANIREVLK